MLLYKGHSSPLFELPTSEPPGKNVSHPFVKIKISFCGLQYATHILSSHGSGEATITKEALARRRGLSPSLSWSLHLSPRTVTLFPHAPAPESRPEALHQHHTSHMCSAKKTLILQNLQMPPAGVIP